MGTYPLGLIISERHNFTLKTKTTTLTVKLKLLSQEGPLAMRCDAMRCAAPAFTAWEIQFPAKAGGWGARARLPPGWETQPYTGHTCARGRHPLSPLLTLKGRVKLVFQGWGRFF